MSSKRESTDKRSLEKKVNDRLDSMIAFLRESFGSLTEGHTTGQNESDTREAQTLHDMNRDSGVSAPLRPEDTRTSQEGHMECVL